jgi:uncharacterized protein YndB with AHSA1/START domain
MTTPKRMELSVEVPGTPEEVWEAIATSRGIESWFAPAEIAGHAGGPVAFDMSGDAMEQTGTVSGWDPPRRFAYEEEWAGSRLATEWLVEAQAGGTCIVRLVSSVFARGDEWDDELDQMREGWEVHLLLLRLHLAHFAGREVGTILATGAAAGPQDRAWGELTAALADAPTLTGATERELDSAHHHGRLMRIDEPGPGFALVIVYTYRERVHTTVHLYLYGADAAAIAARETPRWRAWMEERFPARATAT